MHHVIKYINNTSAKLKQERERDEAVIAKKLKIRKKRIPFIASRVK